MYVLTSLCSKGNDDAEHLFLRHQEHLNKNYYKPYMATVEPLFTQPFEIRILKREKPFIAGKKGNFNPAIGEGNEGISFHVNVEIQPEKLEEFKGWWKEIFSTVAGEEVMRIPP